MDNTPVEGNRNNNDRKEDEFDNCMDDKVSVYETVISGGFINEEVYDTDNKQRSIHAATHENINDRTIVGFIKKKTCNTEYNQGSIHNYVRIKKENIDDLVIPKTEYKPNCRDDKMCLHETAISRGYIKQETCEVKDEQATIQNYLGLKEENINIDQTVVAQETESLTDCDYIDNKLFVYETIISGGYIKEEPCDTGEKLESIRNNVDMKGCEACGEKYDLYCLKCPMLIRIFNSNNRDGTDNSDRQTLPKSFVDICATPSGVGIVALRPIPKGVVFGPFEGLGSTKDEVISKLKLTNKELVLTKDPKGLNWMQYIRRADTSSCQNLVPFQDEDGLYYRSKYQINVGDELLVYFGGDDKENKIQEMEDSYWEPQICESLDDSYACTFCCVGYKSISHLKAHNSTCIQKRNRKDFSKEIVQCDTCKIYLDKKEYSDYHMDRCYKSDGKCLFNSDYRTERGRPFRYRTHNDNRPFSCTLCPYKATENYILKRHVATHNDDKPFACTLCPYKTKRKSMLKQHIDVHNEGKAFACTLCPYKGATKWLLKQHMVAHNDDKPFACTFCPYKTTRKSHLREHIAVHNDDKPFACTLCPYKTTIEYMLKRHIAVHNDDKPFACTVCFYKAKRESNLKQHIATHNDDKPFACTLCPYKTTTKHILKRHIATHNDDKQFVCTLCPYKTARKLHLKQHIVAHNDGKPHACIHCPYKSARISHLKQHNVVHTGDKPFACTICPYKTARKSRLKQHTAVHHGNDIK